LENDINEKAPWKKLNGVTTLLCCFDLCYWGCIHSSTSTVPVLK